MSDYQNKRKNKLNSNIPVNFFINNDVKVEKNAFDELDSLLTLNENIEKIKEVDSEFFVDSDSSIQEVAITPDFHKAAGIPVGTTLFTNGFVIPQAIGNDINCGMRFYTTNLSEDSIRKNMINIEKNIRHIFFEGGRNIPMTKINREAILKEGLIGLLETHKNMENKGLWKHYDALQQEKDLLHVNKMGSFITDDNIGLEDFIGSESIGYDSQIGSIGGGNHFVEIQKVTKIHNHQIANQWNLKVGQITFMIHTGSVAIGHHSGGYIKEMLKTIYPKQLEHPKNGIFVLPKSERYKKEWDTFWSLLHNAANFAFANRMFLGLMLYKSLFDELSDFDMKLLYDAPHNYVWEETIDNKDGFIHRKGSCTAKSAEQMVNTPFYSTGEPVMIPGSMGASSYLLAGLGNRDSLFSASHGAGRQLSRGETLKVDDKLFREFLTKFKVINPIDPNRVDLRNRTDILKKWEEELKKEAPYAYKDISPIIQTHVDHNMAQVVAEVEPLLTIKG
jgi:tRNA-splicing ligase RtcB